MLRLRSALPVPLAALIGVALFATPAHAQQQPTLSATGMGMVKPAPKDRHSDASIRAAVNAANTAALPKAIADARVHAAQLAAAAGVTLGPLLSIADAPNSGISSYYLQNGTFGNGHFCGKVRNTKTVVRDGKRRRVAAKGTHRICRVPPQLSTAVSLTFSITPAAS
jgi:uncharacterized protein YggE